MNKYISWLILAVCIFAFVIQPCHAVELIISDSGRNTAWSRNLNIGDDFSVKGTDDKPVGGIIPHTTAIHQALVPMPNKIELEQMSQKQEEIWVESLGELLKDRVHIATTNGATIFEIRLLQDTPQPSAATMSWQENPQTGRFARMSYQAVGKLVEHLQERKEPVRITFALADSGCTAFAQAIESWKPYSNAFRRVDMVDGRASLTEIRPVISALGGKRVRLFHTAGIPATPAMTIGRREVAESLLKSNPYLTLYTLTSTAPEAEDSGQYAQTPWMTSLSGSRAFTVKRRQYVDGKVIEQTLAGDLTGLDFRDPIAGLDPQDLDLHTTGSLIRIGVMVPVSHQTVVPTLHDSITTDDLKLESSRSQYSKFANKEARSIAHQAYEIETLRKQGNPVSNIMANWKGNRLVEKLEGNLKNKGVFEVLNRDYGNAIPTINANLKRVDRWNNVGAKTVTDTMKWGGAAVAGLGSKIPHPAAPVVAVAAGVGIGGATIPLDNSSRTHNYEIPKVQEMLNNNQYTSNNSFKQRSTIIKIPKTSQDTCLDKCSSISSGQMTTIKGRSPYIGQLLSKLDKASYDPINLRSDCGSNKTVVDLGKTNYSSNNYKPLSSTFRELEQSVSAFPNLRTSKLLPTSTSTQDIGGVMLNTSAKVEGDGTALNTGNVSLVFQNSAGVIDFMKLQRFATALWATYLSVEGPGISIDPVSKSFKQHGDKHDVRYIGQVHNTELGKVMRETDHLMKRWAIGTHRPDISNFLSPDEIDKKMANKMASNRASRFWFIPEGLSFKRSDNMLLFSGGRMTLQTEYLDDNPEGEKNEANELFAHWFTENYDLVAERYPIFRELFEYAQLVSLSTYLRENRVPMLWFLMANREIILTENSISEVDQLVKKSGYKWYVKIYGGVELQLGEALRDENSYEDDPALQDAENVLRDNSSDRDGSNAPIVFSANDTSYTVASKNTLKLFNSSAEGDTIQTDLVLVDKYHEEERGGDAADKKEWNLIAPRMELIRYYSPGLKTRAQFGDGWHLLVPFRLETETQTSLPGTGFIPKRVVMVNLLSGIREVLLLEGREGVELRYVPEESGGLTDKLYRYPDGSWILQDILGAKFVFDQEGDLRQMTLREDNTVKFKLKSKKYNKRIPGYTVTYCYNTRKINGQDLKVLTSIKQGGNTARVDWHPDNNILRIASIRVLRQGQVGPVEILNYEYGQYGMLARITSQSSRNLSVRYEDNNMRVVVLQK